ncbi:MAG: hypothetical protein A2315_05805 [Ignavibacteria bacterium RIFOXYB2_FULL_35_12]|nr:MAG: hypothetical protein A2058_08415 [Ignavibacteria bacterium GWA2_36_19]OGU59338.1 MAG: hypothetical protein A2X60_10925 [Ignavibacteria bacterium GWF2_35_20]OGU81113.1 MAG: hypothetical protein A2254_14495 [Ignavibacteria bacterium RIFOXYA2_FULL_35_9]OGU86469.1 MAG: hypothetical protein A3K31_07335 [Ignavibacteria bacterium RIFOXYA12_FULL_35_25]OGU92348.1 MAG: hypothetical protein A2492_13060 [Ignavibacteria bacterium RIFOXYC12_FULL_35_11]OGU97718.1 MAG: hypothetical protein A2347_17285
MKLEYNPFDVQRLIGSVAEVHPTFIKVNFPSSELAKQKSIYGFELNEGYVGEFAVIEENNFAIFGKITSVQLPDSEKPIVEKSFNLSKQVHPIGMIQLLSCIDTSNDEVVKGISIYPKIGAKVYAAHPTHLKHLVEWSSASKNAIAPISLEMASLSNSKITNIKIPAEDLFGRHCAILGSTGSGKSWTIAKLIEESSKFNSRLILVDATGEFHTLKNKVQKVYLGRALAPPTGFTEVVIPHTSLYESDLFAMLRPSGLVQGPKLRAAIKTLKLLKLVPVLANNGIFRKAGVNKTQYEASMKTNIRSIESPIADFDIKKLVSQIDEECVYLNDFNNTNLWGKEDPNAKSNCVSLLTRIDDIINSPDLDCIFNPVGKISLYDILNSFLAQNINTILLISLKHLSFAHYTRELIANAIGRFILGKARTNSFSNKPLVLFVDEAHQFLNKVLGDENNRYPLDQFELIAKEGRKHSLNICISTQRPRDIPEGILSQMGTLIVHRLINDKDREVVERAAGEIDRSAAAFLPNLTPGQAIIIGVNFPLPVTLKINEPSEKPESEGADYQKYWS